LEIDPNLAEAHASLGQVAEYFDYDFATAEKEFRHAIELNPNYASAHQWFGEHLSALNRVDEALVEIRRALELDPMSVIMNKIYADILADGRRFDEAIEQYKKAIELDPNFATTYYFLGRAYEAKREYVEAVQAYGKMARLGRMPAPEIAKTEEIFRKSGFKAYLEASLPELEQHAERGQVPPFVVASFYARLGKTDEAMKWLEKAYDDRDFRVIMIGVSFEFDSLRADPRFIELSKKVGLPNR
jgi:tetratricopeptide (TPR) repeat protein